jgi:uncharacterized membrane protein (UPF0182 family)
VEDMTFPNVNLPRASQRRPAIFLGVIAVFLVSLVSLVGYYTDWLWFRSVNAEDVFVKILIYRITLFASFFLITALVIWSSLAIAYRLRPPFSPVGADQLSLQRYRENLDPIRRVVFIGLALVLGFLSGASASGQWQLWMQYFSGQPFGVSDPQFNRDIGFFVYEFPLYRTIVSFFISTIVLSLIAASAIHYIYGGLRLQGIGSRASKGAQVQISILLGFLFIVKSAAYYLDRYELTLQQDSLIVGMKYVDVNAVLPAKTLLMYISLIVAAIFFFNAIRQNWLFPIIGAGALFAIAILVGGAYPALLQQFVVRPTEADREAPYIQRNIDSTILAFGLDKVKKEDYPASTTPDLDLLQQQTGTLEAIRLMDPALLSPTYRQLQQVRGYYAFADVLDIDRYKINGQTRGTVIAVREINLAGIAAQQQNWINQHVVYTHGYGVVAAYDNISSSEGEPSFFSTDIPPKGLLEIDQPRIYFGENSPSYSIVGAPAGVEPRELDYPDDTSPTGQTNNTYDGAGGIEVGSLWSKIIFAIKYQEPNIILSDLVNPASKILENRDPSERVSLIAPWLTLDKDPYPIVVDGRIKWMIDGYTTSNLYPYAARTSFESATVDSITNSVTQFGAPLARNVNYVRNSVKATVDAYDGTISIYAFDPNEPLLKTWDNAFPGILKPLSEMPESVKEHIRYPEDLFKIQREILSRYHVSDALSFYSGQDFWVIPDDPTRPGSVGKQPPYYLQLQMPGDSAPVFSLTTTFAPTRRQTLASFMAVSSDPANNYGEIRLLQLPRNTVIPGPIQVQNNFESDPDVGALLNLLRRGGSDVELGNLLSLPIAGGLLYVEPVYVRAVAGDSYPLLRRVLASFGQRVVFEEDLASALAALFGPQSGFDQSPATPDSETGETPTTPTQPETTGDPELDLALALADMRSAIERGKQALENQDFAAYGEAQKDLEAALDRALAAQRLVDGTLLLPEDATVDEEILDTETTA